MGDLEIKEIGYLLKVHRLIDELTERVQTRIPARQAVKDSVYRAFRDIHTHTPYLNFIRQEGKNLLKEKGYAVIEVAA